MKPTPKNPLWTAYRATLHPIFQYMGFSCRFEPSCSRYFFLAIEKYGLVRGTAKGTWRIMRCNPFNKNFGPDPV